MAGARNSPGRNRARIQSPAARFLRTPAESGEALDFTGDYTGFAGPGKPRRQISRAMPQGVPTKPSGCTHESRLPELEIRWAIYSFVIPAKAGIHEHPSRHNDHGPVFMDAGLRRHD